MTLCHAETKMPNVVAVHWSYDYPSGSSSSVWTDGCETTASIHFYLQLPQRLTEEVKTPSVFLQDPNAAAIDVCKTKVLLVM